MKILISLVDFFEDNETFVSSIPKNIITFMDLREFIYKQFELSNVIEDISQIKIMVQERLSVRLNEQISQILKNEDSIQVVKSQKRKKYQNCHQNPQNDCEFCFFIQKLNQVKQTFENDQIYSHQKQEIMLNNINLSNINQDKIKKQQQNNDSKQSTQKIQKLQQVITKIKNKQSQSSSSESSDSSSSNENDSSSSEDQKQPLKNKSSQLLKKNIQKQQSKKSQINNKLPQNQNNQSIKDNLVQIKQKQLISDKKKVEQNVSSSSESSDSSSDDKPQTQVQQNNQKLKQTSTSSESSEDEQATKIDDIQKMSQNIYNSFSNQKDEPIKHVNPKDKLNINILSPERAFQEKKKSWPRVPYSKKEPSEKKQNKQLKKSINQSNSTIQKDIPQPISQKLNINQVQVKEYKQQHKIHILKKNNRIDFKAYIVQDKELFLKQYHNAIVTNVQNDLLNLKLEEQDEEESFSINELNDLFIHIESIDEQQKLFLNISNQVQQCDNYQQIEKNGYQSPKCHVQQENQQQDDQQNEKIFKFSEYSVENSIAKQVNFYFSDKNYQNDVFIQAHVKKSQDRYMAIELLLNFGKIKQVTKDLQYLISILKQYKNDQLNYELSEDCSQIRKKICD